MAVTVPARLSTLAPPERERERESSAWWGLAGCLLLAVVLRLPYLGTSLGRDEGGVAFIARNWPSGHGSLLDPHGRTKRLIARGYRLSATVYGRRIYRRSDR